MDGISLEEFQQRVIAACADSPVVQNIIMYEARPNAVRLRLFLIDQIFLDVFYNEWKGRVSFAWIANDQRVFGADNAGDWHWHPREDPTQHVPSDHEIPFERFPKEIEKTLG